MDGTAFETQPLLQRPAQPINVLARCLLALSGGQLSGLFIVLFLCHTARQGNEGVWVELLHTFFKVDIMFSVGAVVSILATAGIGMYLTSSQATCEGRCFFPLVVGASGSIGWCSVLRLSQAHHLELFCFSVQHPEYCRSQRLDALYADLIQMWHTTPVGLFHVCRRALRRPMRWLLGQPGYALGNGETWEVRELIVGSAFWFSVMSSLTLAVYVVSTRPTFTRQLVSLWFMFWLSVSLTVGMTYVVWVLTCDPLQWFWGFLVAPPFKSFRAPESMQMEEWLGLVLSLWLLARCLYLTGRGRFEGWVARQRCEETLRRALEHPFRADLEKGFAAVLTMDSEPVDLTQVAKDGVVPEAQPEDEVKVARPEVEPPPSHGDGAGSEEEPAQRQFEAALSSLGGGGGALSSSRGGRAEDGAPGARLMEVRRRALARACRQHHAEVLGSEEILAESIQVHLRRAVLLEDTWRVMVDRPVSELLAATTIVSFEGEEGLDSGGLARDWFDSVGRALAEDSERLGGLLCPAPDGTLMPRSASPAELDFDRSGEERLLALLALGRFAALAAISGRFMPLTLNLLICKYLLHLPVNMDDVRRLDPDFFKQRVEAVLRPGGVHAVNEAVGTPLSFTAAPSPGHTALTVAGEVAESELMPGGTARLVTEDSKVEYIRLLCEAYLCGGVRREMQCLLQGFWDVMPLEVLQELGVGPPELSVLISGVQDLDAAEWQRTSRGASSDRVLAWFWEVVKDELSSEERALLLHFATGSSRLPPGGFRALRPRFSVDIIDGHSAEHLPHAHTCINKLVLHRYASKEQLREKLLVALSAEGFAFA